MSQRPQTLRDVAVDAAKAPALLHPRTRELLDEFYMDHNQKPAQQARIDAEPPILGDAFADAWLAAVAEHLALRWGLAVPAWVERPAGFLLSKPAFLGSESMKPILLNESPYPFRRRMIFVEAEPLRRARFPTPHVRPLSEQVAEMPVDASLSRSAIRLGWCQCEHRK